MNKSNLLSLIVLLPIACIRIENPDFGTDPDERDAVGVNVGKNDCDTNTDNPACDEENKDSLEDDANTDDKTWLYPSVEPDERTPLFESDDKKDDKEPSDSGDDTETSDNKDSKDDSTDDTGDESDDKSRPESSKGTKTEDETKDTVDTYSECEMATSHTKCKELEGCLAIVALKLEPVNDDFVCHGTEIFKGCQTDKGCGHVPTYWCKNTETPALLTYDTCGPSAYHECEIEEGKDLGSCDDLPECEEFDSNAGGCEDQPYCHSVWGYEVLDNESGEDDNWCLDEFEYLGCVEPDKKCSSGDVTWCEKGEVDPELVTKSNCSFSDLVACEDPIVLDVCVDSTVVISAG